jgi:hypothetical protein
MNAVNNPVADRNMAAIERVLIQGDLGALTPELRVNYYQRVCESLGLNPLTKPFEYITLNGRLVLYARRDCTDQLRKINGVSIRVTNREVVNDICIVTANAKDKHGREDESTGAVNIKGLSGEVLANAYMKAETKAKRRVTLSICGLGVLDETEDADPEGMIGGNTGVAPVRPQKPEPGNGIIHEGYRCPGHLDRRIAGKTIHQCDPEVLRSVVEDIEAKHKGKAIPGKAQEFIGEAEKAIAAWENAPVEVEQDSDAGDEFY